MLNMIQSATFAFGDQNVLFRPLVVSLSGKHFLQMNTYNTHHHHIRKSVHIHSIKARPLIVSLSGKHFIECILLIN